MTKKKAKKIYTKQPIFENLSKQGKISAQLEKNFFLTGNLKFPNWTKNFP